jgi:2-polyprenyl-3-methyl-5-hydroxy-6-metoxy-1,4-benzoquinol methylase
MCNSKKIKRIYNFGLIPIGNDLQKNYKNSLRCKKYPLELMNCIKCNHFQISVSVNPKILYAKNYTYLTGVTKTFEDHFENYSKWIIQKCKLKKKALVLDIGSNDGTCLSFFKKENMTVVGIDPAKKPCKIANNKKIRTFNKFFNKKNSKLLEKKFGKFDFITSHNVLAHTENIQEIFFSIYNLLKENAYFCFEIGYFKDVIKNNLFDTIYHEHLDYYHAKPLVNFLEKVGFSVIDLSTNKIQGGSLRILLQKKKLTKSIEKIKKFIKSEERFFKTTKIKNKFNTFEKNLLKLNLQITQEMVKNKPVYAFGSPTKASLLLIKSNLNKNTIKNSFEDNTLKCDKYIPGTDIKIINIKKIKKIDNSIIINLAWNFSKEVKNKLTKLNIKNTILLTPLPTIKAIKL